ncbi:sodium transporter HKT1-like [Cornus florida]|uniref:sodium transporter HKT1-like n=1 Tax=Cornus florida TaxID=4283 RepID=UPI0028A1378C|nr:sodium transporter HKT1-like [Cornus florida]
MKNIIGHFFKSSLTKSTCFHHPYTQNMKHSGLEKHHWWTKLARFYHSCHGFVSSAFRVLIFQINPFWIQLNYFIILSLFGFLALEVSKPRTATSRPKGLDVFFTSVSAATVSSMSTVEMEVFSNTQLVILTILMLLGGEVFTSMLGLHFMRTKFNKKENTQNNRVDTLVNHSDSSNSPTCVDRIESGLANHPQFDGEKQNTKYNSIKCLGYVVLCYLLVVHISGSTLISLYTSLVPSARQVLKNKGLHILTFSVFTTVSTFANCGFVPTNENMIVFKNNSGLLLILITQILLGNTLYPTCLRFVIWVLERITRREEFGYVLKNYRSLGYGHLFSWMRCCFLGVTVFGLVLVQFILFCSMEWNSEAMEGLSSYQKIVGSLFVVMNSRHSGESVVDISSLSPAILVVFVVMMYLPPYTSFLPIKDGEEEQRNEKGSIKQSKKLVDNLLFSQLSYLAIFIVLICITESEKLKEDPLNFNLLSITIEVISAYGNVGFSTGYSCKRQLKPDNYCKDAWFGLVGKWSNKGKLILILVMFFGRLKKFNMNGGRAWILS